MRSDTMTPRPVPGQSALSTTQLSVVAYHYVRDLPRTRFPKIKGLLRDGFRRQVDWLSERYEMATLESSLEYLGGRYRPRRDLCLLTFDDGLKEHYTDVLPILAERGIQGVFLLTTSCLGGWVASVHKNHFLLASLNFDDYRRAVDAQLAGRFPLVDTEVDRSLAQQTHRFDSSEVAEFKFLLNYHLPADVRNDILDTLFAEYLGDEQTFAQELYLNWFEAREMQRAQMTLGGHSHRHRALTRLTPEQREHDLATCSALLREHLLEQERWPFSYPHGDTDGETKAVLQKLGFACAFTVKIGDTEVDQRDLFGIPRIDSTEVTA